MEHPLRERAGTAAVSCWAGTEWNDIGRLSESNGRRVDDCPTKGLWRLRASATGVIRVGAATRH